MIKEISPWFEHTPDLRRFKPMTGEERADVVVVGGGMVGVMAAWSLANAGKSVILLERNHVATGDTGFTTGFLTRVPDVRLHELQKRFGSAYLTALFDANARAQETIFELVKKYQIDCGLTRCDSFYVSYEDRDPVLEQEDKALRSANIPFERVGAETLKKIHPGARQALCFANEGYFDVRRFIFGLLAHAPANLKIFEESEALKFETGDTVVVAAKNGRVRAKQAVITTGAPQQQFGLGERLKAMETYVLSASWGPQEAPISDNLFWDTDMPYQYYRHLDARTIMLGGCDRDPEKADEKVQQGMLQEFLKKHFPGSPTVTRQWSGLLFETEDGLPFVDWHPDHSQKVFVSTGFAGNGMVMGTLSGMIIAEALLGRMSDITRLFPFSRPNRTRVQNDAARSQEKAPAYVRTVTTRKMIAWLVRLVWFCMFLLPGIVFFSSRDLSFLSGAPLFVVSRFFFPLIGLYAFFLVWTQVMIGTTRDVLRKIFPNIIRYHRAEGVFALLFAILHPTLLLIGVGLSSYLKQNFVAPNLVIWLWVGDIQLFLIILTASTAFLMRLPWLRTRWKAIHYANYAVFVLVWFHSWFLGHDVQGTALRYLWFLYALTTLIGVCIRIITAKKMSITTSDNKTQWVRVAAVNQVTEGEPFCTNINGKELAVFKIGDAYYALDNRCSHVGGPLCEGKVENGVVVCPWHGSRFDIKTGEVRQGPAEKAQKVFPVRVQGQDIEAQV